MAPNIEVDGEVLSAIEGRGLGLAQARGSAIGITTNDVLRHILELDPKTPPRMPTAPRPAQTATQSPRPFSHNPHVQALINGLIDKLEAEIGTVSFKRDSTGRWISHPNNFFTIKVQDSREMNLSITIYGRPDRLSKSQKIEIKPDRPSYSRFSLQSEQDIEAAVKIIIEAWELKVNPWSDD